jgi:hypothetical protein
VRRLLMVEGRRELDQSNLATGIVRSNGKN